MKVHNWSKWQTYRRDRGQPPWIKVHREVMRKPEWVALSDAQRGQLLAIWLLAADNDGKIPDDPDVISKLCFLTTPLNLNHFIELGFIDAKTTPKRRQRDATATAERRQRDALEAETETEEETEEEAEKSMSGTESDDSPHGPPVLVFPCRSGEWNLTQDLLTELADLNELTEDEVMTQAKAAKAWLLAEPSRKKTPRGMRRFLTSWIRRYIDSGKARRPQQEESVSDRVDRALGLTR